MLLQMKSFNKTSGRSINADVSHLIKIAGDMFPALSGSDERPVVLEGDGSSPDVKSLTFGLDPIPLQLDAANPEAAEVTEEGRVLAAQIVPVVEVLHRLALRQQSQSKSLQLGNCLTEAKFC